MNTGIEATDNTGMLPMLWVLGLMAAVVMSVVSKRKYERMDKRIGVEIELIKARKLRDTPHDKMANWMMKRIQLNDSLKSGKTRKMLRRINIEFDGYTHEVMSRTKLVTDSSLNSGGFEIVSPPLSGDGEQRSWLQRICSALRGVASVDSSCGIHVHVGLKDYQTGQWLVASEDFDGDYTDYDVAMAVVGRVGYAYGYFQPVLNKMVARSRRNGQWSHDTSYLCRQFDNPQLIVVEDDRYWDDENECYEYKTNTIKHPILIGQTLYNKLREQGRYQCVNPEAFSKYGTIEFRSHQGSANANKIQNWIDICYALTARCASHGWDDITQYNGESYHDFMTYLGFAPSDHLYEAGIRRIRSLNGGDPSVFAHDPRIAHSSLFTAVSGCTACGKVTCDHDGECGTNHAELLCKEIDAHFDSGLSYPERTCEGCGDTSIQDSPMIHREYSMHTHAFCNECGDDQSYTMVGGIVLSVAMGVLPLALLVVGCGIGAIHAVAKRFRHKKVASKLFKALSARGKQASGFAFENGDGVYYVKSPHSSHAMAHHMGKQLSRDTQWTMMHTRYATHGVNNKANAHPHLGGKGVVTMVHNGVVHNHNAVWTALKREPTGPVDSQAVAECLYVNGIEEVVKHCEGSMSLIWSDNRDPKGTLKCWTNGGNPLVMGRLDNADNGPVVVASTLALLQQGVGKRLKSNWDATIGREYTIHPDGSITKRDIDGSEETAGFTYDWRTYKVETDYYSTSGKSNPPNYTVIKPKSLTRPNYRVIKLAKDKMLKSPTGSYQPIEGKWDGYDATTHEGICAGKWGYKGEPITYNLPQWLTPAVYEDDLVALLRGDHAPDTPISEWDLCGLDDFEL